MSSTDGLPPAHARVQGGRIVGLAPLAPADDRAALTAVEAARLSGGAGA